MISNAFYAAITLCSVACLVLLWEIGFRKLFLEDFRDALFVVRERLYSLAQEGAVECESPAYRAVESLLNGIIRYAHRFSFFGFLFALSNDRGSKDTNLSAVIRSMISDLSSPYARRELEGVLDETAHLLSDYIARSSLLFLLGAFTLFVLQWGTKPKDTAVSTFEQEAYFAYQSDDVEVVSAA